MQTAKNDFLVGEKAEFREIQISANLSKISKWLVITMHEYSSSGDPPPTFFQRFKCWIGYHAWKKSELWDKRSCINCGLRQKLRNFVTLDGSEKMWEVDHGPPPGPKPTPPPPPPPKQCEIWNHQWQPRYLANSHNVVLEDWICVKCHRIEKAPPSTAGNNSTTQDAYVPTRSAAEVIEDIRSPRVKRTLGC